MNKKLQDLTLVELIDIENIAPDYVRAPSPVNDEGEEVPVSAYFDLYNETIGEAKALPYVISGYRYLINDVRGLSKTLTSQYAAANEDEDQELRDALRAILSYQGWLEGQIARVEEQLKVVQQEDNKYMVYLERLDKIKEHQVEIEKLSRLNEQDGFIHTGRSTLDTPRPKKVQAKVETHPTSYNSSGGAVSEPKAWMDRAGEKTKEATSNALGSTIGFLEKMKKDITK